MATVSRYALKDGSVRWRVRYRTPERRQTDKRGFRTRREASAFAATVEVRKLTGEFVAESAGRVTVGSLGPAWLRRQRGHLKPSTVHSVESAWRVHVQPRWAATPIGRTGFPTCRRGWPSWLTGAGRRWYAPRTRCCRGFWPTRYGTGCWPRTRRPVSSCPVSRRAATSTCPQPSCTRWPTSPAATAPWCCCWVRPGCGWGEVAALRVSDLDLLRRQILLHRNAATVGSQVHLGTLKSGKHRVVPLAGFVADALARTCEGKSRDSLLWPARDGGYLGPPSAHSSWLSGAVARCRTADPSFPRVTAHALRHTAASLAISAGANVKAVQRMLGHSSAATTLNVYCDLFDSDLGAVAAAIDNRYAPGRVVTTWAPVGDGEHYAPLVER